VVRQGFVEVVPQEPIERLEEARERRRTIDKQRREKGKELARLRGGTVMADHGDNEEDDDEDLLVWRPSPWRRFAPPALLLKLYSAITKPRKVPSRYSCRCSWTHSAVSG
jgi:hypothetical protein